MNLDQLKRNLYWRVQLIPVACRLDEFGIPLPSRDDDWLIEEVTDEHIRISNITTQIFQLLGKDHIHHFTTNPQRSQGDVKFGFLTLHVQIFCQGVNAWVRPNIRPGEAVAPLQVEIREKIVDFQYPSKSGLEAKLNSQGYRLVWSNESNLSSRLDFEGWEIVIDKSPNGELNSFRVRDRIEDQILLKKRI
jgi:hypothetical protein